MQFRKESLNCISYVFKCDDLLYSIILFLHPAVQIYEIYKINYFNTEMVYIKYLNVLFVKHNVLFFFFFFYSLQTQDRPDFCSGRLQRKRAFHESKLPSS